MVRMRPEYVFDIVLERVREYQALADRVTAIRCDASSRGGPTKTGNVMVEYIADFQKLGRRTLKPWPKRVILFDLYFVQNLPYRMTSERMKIPIGTLDYWVWNIKRCVGEALHGSVLFPPRRYRELEGARQRG
jgi:hypothetical protein